MAHQPATIGGEPAFAYQTDNPFFSMGTRVPEGAGVAEMLRAAKLDYDVRLEPMFFSQPGVGDAGSLTWKQVPNRKAVVRIGDDEVLGTVGDKYKITQYAEAFSVLEPMISEFGVVLESAGALNRGEQAWVLAKLPNAIEVVPGDKVGGYFLLKTGHDGATPFIGSFIPWRFHCTNAINMALASGTYAFRLTHLMETDRQLDHVASIVKTIMQALEKSGDTFRMLAQKRMSAKAVLEYAHQVLGLDSETEVTGVAKRRLDNILHLVWSGKGADEAGSNVNKGETTAWAALNAVTEYMDHVLPAEKKNPKATRRANESAIFGRNALLKIRALNLATEGQWEEAA